MFIETVPNHGRCYRARVKLSKLRSANDREHIVGNYNACVRDGPVNETPQLAQTAALAV
jgi:hypothetical protein